MVNIPDDIWQWLNNNDTGISSRTIASVLEHEWFMPSHFKFDIPHDPDDFGRCHRLLQSVPRYKNRLHEVAEKVPFWKPYIDNWEKMTQLYIRDTKGLDPSKFEWYSSELKSHELYEFMQKLKVESDQIRSKGTI